MAQARTPAAGHADARLKTQTPLPSTPSTVASPVGASSPSDFFTPQQKKYHRHGDDWQLPKDTKHTQSPIELPSKIFAEIASPLSAEVSAKLQWKATTCPMTFSYGPCGISVRPATPNLFKDVITLEVKGKKGYLDHWHFHSDAEHVVEGEKRAVGEVHYVFLTAEGAVLGVIGFILEESDKCNEGLRWMSDCLRDPAFNSGLADAKAVFPGFDMSENHIQLLMSGRQDKENLKARFANYDGSLTTPPCTEGLIWFVQKTKISRQQADQLRILHKGCEGGNYRSLQALNGRKVVCAEMQYV